MLRTFLILILFCLLTPFAWAGTVDINTAGIAELDTLPGIGPAKAQAILDHRSVNGPFVNIVQIMDVSGIGPATFENIRPLINTGNDDGSQAPGEASAAEPDPAAVTAPREPAGGPPTTQLNVNTATAAELQMLPGIGPTKAQAIVDDRTNNGPFAQCSDLARVAGIGPATVANVSANCTTK